MSTSFVHSAGTGPVPAYLTRPSGRWSYPQTLVVPRQPGVGTPSATNPEGSRARLTSRRAQVNSDVSKFNFYVQNIATETTNLQSANSLISDVDVATESTALAPNNILVQASSSMLAQANASQNSLLVF